MDFESGEEGEALRKEVRALLEEHVTDDVHDRMEGTGTHHDRQLQLELGARGWIAPGWPVDEGGGGRSWAEQAVLAEEFQRAQAPIVGVGTTMLVVNTIRIWGSPAQKADVIPRALRGEMVICLGYSEPDGGSDVAAARTTAVRDGNEWVINGEKMFTTLAHVADYVFLVTRTNLDAKKHQGLTMFLVPMSTPGVVVAEVKTLGGERTNITTYLDVRVGDECRVGDVDAGWSVLTTALQFEHSGGYGHELERLLSVAVDEAAKPGPDSARTLDDPLVRGRLARIAIDVEVSNLLATQSGWMYSVGQSPAVEGSMSKLYSSEAFARASSEVLAIFGPHGLEPGHGHDDTGLGVIEHAFRHSQVTRIYAGTSEIHRSIVAERGLGLPRTRS
jgi:alkylation response protein AidB-like acyl-CoA dehydrogenase